jgi:DivIVA domain-containing protein
MGTAYDDRPDMTVPARQALTSVDIETARFAVGVRGYRMDEVDTLLERVAKEVAERDRRIADLERAVAPIVESPEGLGFTSHPYDIGEFEDTGTQQPILVGGDFPEPAADPAGTEPAADGTTDAGSAAGTTGAEAGATDAADTGVAGAGAAGAAAGGGDSVGTTDGGATGAATAAGAALGGSAGAQDAEDEPETRELPRASQAAADEYERLQAEARAVLEAQSQPVTPRRTPPPHEPAASPQQPQEEEPPQAFHEEPQPSQEQSQASREQSQAAYEQPQSYQQPVQAPASSKPAPLTPAQQYDRLRLSQPQVKQQQPHEPAEAASENTEQGTSQQPGAAEQTGDGEQGEGAGEAAGWRFWPPADQEGEGAYQRPS